jgi:hypothetical protein
VYLALLEVEVGLSSSFVDPLLFCLASRRFFTEETAPRCVKDRVVRNIIIDIIIFALLVKTLMKRSR